jgi:hypothetical protein
MEETGGRPVEAVGPVGDDLVVVEQSGILQAQRVEDPLFQVPFEGFSEIVNARSGGCEGKLGEERKRTPKEILWDPVTAEKGGYKHFMLKEIFEQPRAVVDTIRGRISLEEGEVLLQESGLTPKALKDIRRVCIIACGTSSYAALGPT